MNLNDLLENILFSFGDYNITVGNILASVGSIVGSLLLYALLRRRLLPIFFRNEEVAEVDQQKINRLVGFCLLLLAIIGIIVGMDIDLLLFSNENVSINISNVLLAFFFWQSAQLFDILISKTIIHNYYETRKQEEPRRFKVSTDSREGTHRMVQYVVYVLALLLIVKIFQLNFVLYTFVVNDTPYRITVSNLLVAILIVLVARLFIWIFTKIVLHRYYQKKKIDIGSQYAVNQLLSYFVYLLAILLAIQSLGFNLVLIWGGLAALLLGIGLGLQQIFSDLVSGLILLFERTIEVGDIVVIGEEVCVVKRIGLRTSKVQTRNNMTIILPNSRLIVEKVTNWSHDDRVARFNVNVGVAYGSDTALVKNLLIEVASKHPKIMKAPKPFVWFADFGNSSLDFELYFWSSELFPIEHVKSELRFEIDRVFREHNVTIPFPQRDVWFKNPMPGNGQ